MMKMIMKNKWKKLQKKWDEGEVEHCNEEEIEYHDEEEIEHHNEDENEQQDDEENTEESQYKVIVKEEIKENIEQIKGNEEKYVIDSNKV